VGRAQRAYHEFVRILPRTAPTKLAVAMLLLGLAAFFVGWFVLRGSPDTILFKGSHHGSGGVHQTTTGAVDIVKFALTWGGVALALAGLLRWYTRNEAAELNDQEARRRFGDSITDARTNQDPLVGMLPVSSTEPRHR
jgi:hypothetical protein